MREDENIWNVLDRIERKLGTIESVINSNTSWACGTPHSARIVARYLPNPPNWTQIWVNPQYCRFFGCTYEEAVNRSTLETTAPHFRRTAHRKLLRVMRQRIPLMGLEPSRLSDGTIVNIRWMDIPVLSCAGGNQVIEMIAIADVKL
jgi:PAS domain S-box-containing protein